MNRETGREIGNKLLNKMNLKHRPNYVDSSGASYFPLDGSTIDDNSIVDIHKNPPSITINGETISKTSDYRVVRYNNFLAIYGKDVEPTVIDLEEIANGE